MSPRARRKTEESASEIAETPAVDEVQEENVMAENVVDDVVEDEASAPAKRGRKPDVFKAATDRLSAARKNVALAKSVPPLDQAEAELADAKAAVQTLIDEL
jgi:hypothetical protein